MKKGRLLTSALVLTIVTTNGFWFWVVDSNGLFSPARGWAETQCRNAAAAADGAIALIPVVAGGHSSKAEILDALRRTNPTWDRGEVNNIYYVGGLELQFNAEGNLAVISKHVDICC